jgi:hypothetical protein
MDSEPWVIPLAEGRSIDEQRIGGKAAQLARLHRKWASGSRLDSASRWRPTSSSSGTLNCSASFRWNSAASRSKNCAGRNYGTPRCGSATGFLRRNCRWPWPSDLRSGRNLGSGTPLAVRSSAPGEDSADRSFAGLHESFLFVVGEEAVLESVRLVWASLWSDAALLYRQELALDPLRSRMAVLIQEMRTEDRSGVAFGRDPRTDQNEHAVIEAVPGPLLRSWSTGAWTRTTG